MEQTGFPRLASRYIVGSSLVIGCVSDVSSSFVNLQGRQDATFFLCGEVCRFISKLCSRCYLPETIPVENAWFFLLGFTISEGKFLTEEDFLIRLRLVNKVATASKQSAEIVHLNKKSETAAIDKTADEATSSFAKEGLHFIQYLLKEVLNQTGLRSEIVKGLAAFDPFILVKKPSEVGLRHFDLLYATFQHRSWVTTDNEDACREEYIALLDHLRVHYSSDFDLLENSKDHIDFLMGLDFFQTQEHLLYLFKLCCLCLTSASPQYPAALFGSVDTTGYRGRFTDLILPCQSYLSSVPDSISGCVTDANLDRLSHLSASFEHSAFAAGYDQWTYVDVFGRSKIYKSLLSSYKLVTSISVARSVRLEERSVSSVPDESALKLPSKLRRKRQSRSSSSLSSSSKRPVQGTSKD